MNMKKIKLRKKILRAFIAILFLSSLLTGIIFNIVMRFTMDGERAYNNNYYFYDEAARMVGRASLTLVVLIVVMFITSCVVTYFLSNSITRPIEQLGVFAANIGKGNFTQQDFKFNEVELHELNMALNKSAKQLSVYDSEQKAFFQNASHELRTPLMSIKCYAEGISFGIMDAKNASETILHETDKLADLVTDLLYIAKIDNITTAFTITEIDLASLIRSCAARQEAIALKHDLSFVFEFTEEPILYNCVGELFSRAIDNLISNAIRYSKSQIILSCHKNARNIEISITDDGAGVEENVLPHLFERFTKGSDGNHGIGLSIVKSIVEQQGGSITAKNNGGAVFTITLPI